MNISSLQQMKQTELNQIIHDIYQDDVIRNLIYHMSHQDIQILSLYLNQQIITPVFDLIYLTVTNNPTTLRCNPYIVTNQIINYSKRLQKINYPVENLFTSFRNSIVLYGGQTAISEFVDSILNKKVDKNKIDQNLKLGAKRRKEYYAKIKKQQMAKKSGVPVKKEVTNKKVITKESKTPAKKVAITKSKTPVKSEVATKKSETSVKKKEVPKKKVVVTKKSKTPVKSEVAKSKIPVKKKVNTNKSTKKSKVPVKNEVTAKKKNVTIKKNETPVKSKVAKKKVMTTKIKTPVKSKVIMKENRVPASTVVPIAVLSSENTKKEIEIPEENVQMRKNLELLRGDSSDEISLDELGKLHELDELDELHENLEIKRNLRSLQADPTDKLPDDSSLKMIDYTPTQQTKQTQYTATGQTVHPEMNVETEYPESQLLRVVYLNPAEVYNEAPFNYESKKI